MADWTHWTIADTDPPAPGTTNHWVIRPRRPVPDLTDLDGAERAELWAILDALVGDNPGWCLINRNGDPVATGGPVGQEEVTVADDKREVGVRLPVSGRAGPDLRPYRPADSPPETS